MIRADELSKSQFVTILGRPCRITSITFSATSHNTPTLHIMGIDITTDRIPRSFLRNPQQTYSLYSSPTALVPVPLVSYIRGDRLQIGDYVNSIMLRGHITQIHYCKVGLKQMIHLVTREVVTGVFMTGIMWDGDLIEVPRVQSSEFRALGFVAPQVISIVCEGVNSVQIGCQNLSRQIEKFWGHGNKEIWITILVGGVVGAFEVRELLALALEENDFLLLSGEGRVPDMMIKKPRGLKGDKIDGLIKEGKRFIVRVRADMGQEVGWDNWTVDDARRL